MSIHESDAALSGNLPSWRLIAEHDHSGLALHACRATVCTSARYDESKVGEGADLQLSLRWGQGLSRRPPWLMVPQMMTLSAALQLLAADRVFI